ncbi:hypothetical protein SKAU_G00244770 [Synaphobranchus kaupii]|uniref:Uncharacterized protein n=1 Tax=Synaphobranchus kaupii TaxID=118154 RepID=A0A9Q1F1N6_SYNKA|nr:hypothetical protein SKAU_G00244770 [Synaphobranchus kaupii]
MAEQLETLKGLASKCLAQTHGQAPPCLSVAHGTVHHTPPDTTFELETSLEENEENEEPPAMADAQAQPSGSGSESDQSSKRKTHLLPRLKPKTWPCYRP